MKINIQVECHREQGPERGLDEVATDLKNFLEDDASDFEVVDPNGEEDDSMYKITNVLVMEGL